MRCAGIPAYDVQRVNVQFIYLNEAQGPYSKLDYYFMSNIEYITDFKVFDALQISLTMFH